MPEFFLNAERPDNEPPHNFKRELATGWLNLEALREYMDRSDFAVLAVEVAHDNPYVKIGDKVRDLRAGSFCLKLGINHKDNRPEQGIVLTREDLEDKFKVTFDAEVKID